MIQLYIFADQYDIPQLRNPMCDWLYLGNEFHGLPQYACIILAFESLPETSALCRILVDISACRFKRYNDDEGEQTHYPRLPHSFLLQVMLRMSELRQSLEEREGDEALMWADMCKYHEHKSDDEGAACKKAWKTRK